MIYYIDVQPVKKKVKHPFRKLRAWIYSSALLFSFCMVLPFCHPKVTPVRSVTVSATEYEAMTAVSPTETVEAVSVNSFINFISPLDSAFISSHFGYRTNPVSGKYKLHGGLDLAACEGSPIYAVLSGEVTASKYSDSYGNYVVIDHKNGYETLYAHCSELLCSKGDAINKGDVIALVGSTGNSTGPHLHIEVRKDGERTDPEVYFGAFFQ